MDLIKRVPGIKSFNKLFLNRITMWIARRSHGPFAIVCHVGRQTGKLYKTPIIPYPIDDSFIAALTYGHAVDWFQNVKSVGRCTVLWHGKEYSIDKIENIDSERAFSIYSRGYRFILKRTHTKDFVRLYYSNEEEFVATNSSHKLRSSVRATEAVMPSILSSVPISATKQVTHVPYLASVSF